MQIHSQNRPIEVGNANRVREICLPAIKLVLLRYETIANFLTDEPCLIHIYPETDEERIVCERILSIHLDIPNSHAVTYMIFSNSREEFSHDWYTVVRKVYWDKKNDQNRIKGYPDQRDLLLESWPSITISNTAVRQNTTIESIVSGMDDLVKKGVRLSPRKVPLPYWKDMSVMRRYDWGEMRSSWGSSQQNKSLEDFAQESVEKLEQVITHKHPMFHRLDIDYQIPLSVFHKAMIGEIE